MRRQSYLIYFIFGAIILIFAVNFGPGSSGCSRGVARSQATWAARVNGEIIRPQDFGAQLGQRMEALRRMAEQRGQDFDAAMAERMGVRQVVLDQMVERRLVAQEAAKQGIAVSDAALLRYLSRTYGVHRVSYATYAEWVGRTFGTSVAHFEDLARADAAGELLVRAMQDGITVGQTELKTLYSREHDRAKGDFVRFAAADYMAQVPEPTAAAIEDALEHSGSELEAQYSQDMAAYRTPARVHIRQIVRTLDRDASERDVASAQQVLDDLRKQLEGGADFASLAKQHSQDVGSREKGGDLGMLDQGTLAQAIEQAAFTTEPGHLAAETVRTPEGLHLIEPLEIKAAGVTPLSEVRREVATTMVRTRAAKVLAQSQAERFLAQIQAGKSIASLTQDEDAASTNLKPTSLSIKTAAQKPVLHAFGWTRRTDEAVARIGVAPKLQEALFAKDAPMGVMSQVFQVGDSFYVTVLRERETPQMEQFATGSEVLAEEALAQKQRRVLTDWLSYLKTQGKVELNPHMLTSPLQAGSEEGQT